MEFFYNRPAAYTIIVNCQLSIVNSGRAAKFQFGAPKNDTERRRAETTTHILRTTWPPALRAKFQFIGLPKKADTRVFCSHYNGGASENQYFLPQNIRLQGPWDLGGG